jgi:indole-3-glycerol phosphate synthase
MRIGLRYRRAGRIDRILIPKRASIARMLASPLFPARRAPRAAALQALSRPPSGALRVLAELDLSPLPEGEPRCPLAPSERALAYAREGARMISVITDATFGGSFAALAACRDALDDALGDARPALLCHDFILHPVQLDRAVDAGADAVLLIARIVERDTLSTLWNEARARGLDPLVEVATEEELAATRSLGARAVAVSARDLNTGRLHPARALALIEACDPGKITVSLTGADTPAALHEADEAPLHAALIPDLIAQAKGDLAPLRALLRALDRSPRPVS